MLLTTLAVALTCLDDLERLRPRLQSRLELPAIALPAQTAGAVHTVVREGATWSWSRSPSEPPERQLSTAWTATAPTRTAVATPRRPCRTTATVGRRDSGGAGPLAA